MLGTITHLVTSFGYIIVAVFILIECAGFPLPGETVLLVAAGFAGAGKLSIAWVIVIAATAATVGGAGGYWAGRFLGKGFIDRFGRFIGLNEKRMEYLQGFFVKHGAPTVFFGRFVGVLRTYAAMFAGISKMPYGVFLIFNALGAILWASAFGIIGYLFGQNVDEIESLARVFGWGALFGIVMIAAIWYIRRWALSPVSLDNAENKTLRERFLSGLSGSALVTTSAGRVRLSRLSVLLLFLAGLFVVSSLVVFVSSALRGFMESDPLTHFEEVVSVMIDNWLTQRQSLLFLTIAKTGAAVSLAIGILIAIISIIRKRRLYMFAMIFSLVGGETLNALLAFLNRGYNVFVSSHFSVRLGYLLAFDNMIIPVVVFGLLAYFASLSTRQIVMKVTVVAGIWLPAIAILASSFLCDIHGSVEFVEELLCAVIWLWICIGLTQFIRDKQQRQKAHENSGNAHQNS